MGKIEKIVAQADTVIGIDTTTTPDWTPEEQREIYIGLQYLLAEMSLLRSDAAALSNRAVVQQRKAYKEMQDGSDADAIGEAAADAWSKAHGTDPMPMDEYRRQQFENANDAVMRMARKIKDRTKTTEEVTDALGELAGIIKLTKL